MFFSSYLTQNTNKINSFLQPTHTFESLLKWINNIEYPRCLLASQRDDFNDGIILCELVNEIILKNQKPDFLPKINNITPNYHEKLENFDMALQIIQSNKDYPCSEKIGKLTSNDLISDNSKILIILEHMYRISNPSQDTPSSKNERSPSDQQSGISRPSNHQRQLTAEFGFKLDDVPLLQVPDHENSPKAAPSKPPKDPKLMFSKITKGAHSLSQSIRQSPQPRSSSPNKIEFQSTRDTPLKDDHMHHNSSYQSSPANSSLNKRMQHKQDSLRLSPKLDPHLSLSRISPNSEMNNSVTTVNTFFKKEIPSRPASSTSKASVPQIGCNSTRRNMHQTPVLGLRQPQMIENSGVGPLLSISSARHIKTRSSENLNFLSSSRQENRSQIIPPPKARGAGSPSMGRSNSIASISQKSRGVEKKEDIPPYASIITRSNSMSETFRSSSKENKGSAREGSPLSRRSSMRNEEKVEDLVTPVTAEIKAKILDWLLSINILKDSIPDLDKKLHKICKNGLIFVDLLNRLEGRQDVIKGITRDDSKMNIKINYLKIANYLQGFEKMNPRYLSAQEYLMGGDENVFWGFLDDIYNLYHKKISPYDTRYKKNQNKTDRPQTPEVKNTRQSVGNQREKSFRHEKSGDYTRDNKILRDSIRQDCSYLSKDRKSWVSPKEANSINSKFSKLNLEESKFASNNYSSIRTNGRESQFYSQRHHDGNGKENDPVKEICKGLDTPSKRLTPTESYSNIHSRKASACYSGRSSPSNVRRSRASQEDLSKLFLLSESKQENQKSGRPRSRSRSQIEEEENIITTDVENEVLEWLDVQGFSTIILKQQSSLFEDRLRNGSILCKLIANFEGENISPIYGQPKSIDECRYNIYTAFKVLGKKGTPIPSYLKGKEEAILKGNRNILFTLLHSLKKIYTERQNEDKSRIFEPEATFKTSNYVPPYSEQQIKLLEDSLVNWLRSLGLLESKLPRIKSFEGVISHLKDGLLLCDLVSLVLQKKVSPIHAKPNTEPQSISNIRKALEELRKVKDMGQRFLWKDKEIYDGDRFIALGLLEDINRYFHGLKARCPPNYFCEDPYISEVLRDKKDTNDNEHESSVVNYRKYLTNLKNGQSQLTRSSTCPKTRMSYDNKILVNKQDEYNENQTASSQRTNMQIKERPVVNTFMKNGLGNRFFGNEPTNITPELTFSSPFLEGSQLDEYLPKPIPYPKRA